MTDPQSTPKRQIDVWVLFFSNILVRMMTALTVLILPLAVTAEDFVKYGVLLSTVNIVYIVGTVQFMKLYGIEYYKGHGIDGRLYGYALLPVPIVSVLMLLLLAPQYFAPLEMGVLILAGLALSLGNYAMVQSRLERAWRKYVIAGVILTAPTFLVLAVCYGVGIAISAEVLLLVSALANLVACLVTYRIPRPHRGDGPAFVQVMSRFRSMVVSGLMLDSVLYFLFAGLRFYAAAKVTVTEAAEIIFVSNMCALMFVFIDTFFEANRQQLLSQGHLRRTLIQSNLRAIVLIVVLFSLVWAGGLDLLNQVYAGALAFETGQLPVVLVLMFSALLVVNIKWLVLRAGIDNRIFAIGGAVYALIWVMAFMMPLETWISDGFQRTYLLGVVGNLTLCILLALGLSYRLRRPGSGAMS